MSWNIQQVKRALNGRLMGKAYVKAAVCETILLLPDELIEKITRNVWFISSPEDAWAFTFRGSEIKEDHLIVLSDELFEEGERQISYTILHEIGHVLLGHHNSIYYQQTQSEIKMQEKQADEFANKYLDNNSRN